MSRPASSRARRALTSSLVVLACASCGDDGGGSGRSGQFLVGTRIWNDTTTTSYFHVVDSLDAEATVDVARAIEVPGSAKLLAVEGLGWFAFGDGESPTITRYSVDDDGALVAGTAMSLQAYGVTGLWDTLYVASPTKLYYPDRDNSQLIVFDPTTMTISGTIDLGVTHRDGFLSNYGYRAIRRGDQLLVSVGWFDWNDTDSVASDTGLVVIDTLTDTVVGTTVDARCGGITTPIELASGDAYFVSSALAATAHHLGRNTSTPCALRVNRGETAFDPSYLASLTTVTGVAIVGEPVVGGEGTIVLRVFDETLGAPPTEGATWQITGAPQWRWARWNPKTDAFTPIASLPPSTSDVLWFEVDGHVYGTQTAADYSSTTLIDLSAPEPGTLELTVPGFLHGVAKID